jgi:MerR family transcriptional regulator, thiopeptide resistance regulator
MLTISKLAKRFKLSRTTLLYYEKEGLLKPASRSNNGYRWYGDKEISRLESIINYRSFGISIEQIKVLLDKTENSSHEQILRKQFNHLEQAIQSFRQQQLAIVNFLQAPDLLDEKSMTKDKWTSILRASGMDDEAMHNWHRQFEKMEPDAHQEFLESLHIEPAEVKQIREWSRS